MTKYIIEKVANGWLVTEAGAFMQREHGEQNVFLTLDAMNTWLKSKHDKNYVEQQKFVANLHGSPFGMNGYASNRIQCACGAKP